jgi:hypothetical protein
MSTQQFSNFKEKLLNLKENTISVFILFIIIIIIILAICYYLYKKSLYSSECKFMTNIYGTLNNKIKPIDAKYKKFNHNLLDYYIKTAYNCCSGGNYKNDFVNTCNLINVLKQGCRGLDFEIYSIDDNPVVATSTSNNYYVKETYNYVNFSEVMSILSNYAFSQSTSPNYTDPIIIHLRIFSNNQKMFNKFSHIFETYNNLLLGKTYSYENQGRNIGKVPILDLKGKIVIIVDKTNTSFLDNKAFLEYVNITSNSIFMRALHYYDIKNTPDITELQNYNKQNMTIAMPDIGSNPQNPSGIVVRETGCQLIAMRYQYIDQYIEENTAFFNENGFGFVLKPERLRFIPVILPDPTPQKPELSYETRTISSNYYNFNI